MRLTLRTLLAYVDDTLPPDQAREIGQKVAESHVAQELMERIKKVTRRRGLTVPPAAGPERIDANTVAEYLDNDLPADRVAEVEEMALNSDVHLAEIAACHQILTLVLGEPAHVPPTARERMYGLVQGKESEPHRRASRIGPPAFPGEAETADESRGGPPRRRLSVCSGLACSVSRWRSPSGRHCRAGSAQQPPPPDQGGRMAGRSRMSSLQNPTRNQDRRMPEAKAAGSGNPCRPDARKAEAARARFSRRPSRRTVRRAPKGKTIGQFVSKDAVLLARGTARRGSRRAVDAKVRTGRALLALPGSHAEMKLDGGARLTLWGGLPETTGWKVLDCEVTLHAPAGRVRSRISRSITAGSTSGRPRKPGRPRFASALAKQIWDVTLPGRAIGNCGRGGSAVRR